MGNFSVTFHSASREMSTREKLKIRDISDSTKLDEVTSNGNTVIITPVAYAILNVHNEKSDSKDYHTYVIEDKDGTKYYTGSEPFWDSFEEIWEAMDDSEEDIGTWSIKVYKKDSKNYKGKQFLTCTIV